MVEIYFDHLVNVLEQTDCINQRITRTRLSVHTYLRMLLISGNLMEAQRPFFEVSYLTKDYLTKEDHTDSVHYCFVCRARRNSFIT
jgi:hypothetical protein